MDLYYFVYDFVIFGLIDNYDDVFGDLEWFQVRIYVKKKRRKWKQWGLKMAENRGDFKIKLVMIGPLKTYNFLVGR